MGETDKAGLRQMMPSLFNGIATALAAAAGLIGVLHQTGYLGNHPRLRAGIESRVRTQSVIADQRRELVDADAPAAPGVPAASPPNRAEIAASPMHRNISGAWRDGASNCHLIKQIGHALTVSSYAAAGRLRAVGNGTVKGRTVSLRMNSE